VEFEFNVITKCKVTNMALEIGPYRIVVRHMLRSVCAIMVKLER